MRRLRLHRRATLHVCPITAICSRSGVRGVECPGHGPRAHDTASKNARASALWDGCVGSAEQETEAYAWVGMA